MSRLIIFLHQLFCRPHKFQLNVDETKARCVKCKKQFTISVAQRFIK